jgi:hypothetical protein
MGREIGLIEPVASAAGSVESPTDSGPLDAPPPDLSSIVVAAKVCLHQWMRGNRQHVFNPAARSTDGQDRTKQFGPTTDITNAPVRNLHREFNTP